MISALTSHAFPSEGMVHVGNLSMCRNLIHTHHKHLFLTLKKKMFKNNHFCDFHNLLPLAPQENFSACLRALFTQNTGCNIHIGAKLYSLGRANVFSSVATNFGLKTIIIRLCPYRHISFVVIHLHSFLSDRLYWTPFLSKYEPRHDKTNTMIVHPAKTQISLGIHPVSLESSLCAQWVAKDPRFLHADNEDSDLIGRMPRLI